MAYKCSKLEVGRHAICLTAQRASSFVARRHHALHGFVSVKILVKCLLVTFAAKDLDAETGVELLSCASC